MTPEGLYRALGAAGMTCWRAIDLIANYSALIESGAKADAWAEGYAAGKRDQFNAAAHSEYCGVGEPETTPNPHRKDPAR